MTDYMIELIKIGEHSLHTGDFVVDRPAGHPVYLLLIVESEAQMLVGHDMKHVRPGDIVFFKPGQKQYYYGSDGTYCDSWAHIRMDENILPDDFPYGEPITVGDSEIFSMLFHLIYNEFYSESAVKGRVINELLRAFFHKLGYETCGEKKPDIYYRLAKVRMEIYANPGKDWDSESIAKEVGISSGYLHNIYPKFFKNTCTRDVIAARIQATQELLLSTNKPLDAIASEVGYNNTEHFIRQFKKVCGITPGKYRSSHI